MSSVPIFPGATGSHAVEGARRDKLGWDEISARSAKIVSFSGMCFCSSLVFIWFSSLRSGWSRAVSEDDSLWADIRCSVLCHVGNWRKCGCHRDDQGTSSDRIGAEYPCHDLHHEGEKTCSTTLCVMLKSHEIDMTPPNVLAETTKQVVKILRSPGCKQVLVLSYTSYILKIYRKSPVFVSSTEVAVELTSTFAHRKSVLVLLHLRLVTFSSDCVPYFESRTLMGMVSTTSVKHAL